jgi:pimeloyl-ACP methyl ester carboxylesterase
MKRVVVTVLSALCLASTVRGQNRTVNVGDAVINYEVTGQGEPLVLIHGWSQDLLIWDGQVAEFSRHYRVIRYDRRGNGKSTGNSDYSADPQDLRILLDSLGIRSASLLGLSSGARTVVNFAVAFSDRVKALVIYGLAPIPGFTPMPEGPTPVAVFREIAQKYGLDSAGKALPSAPIGVDAAQSTGTAGEPEGAVGSLLRSRPSKSATRVGTSGSRHARPSGPDSGADARYFRRS